MSMMVLRRERGIFRLSMAAELYPGRLESHPVICNRQQGEHTEVRQWKIFREAGWHRDLYRPWQNQNMVLPGTFLYAENRVRAGMQFIRENSSTG